MTTYTSVATTKYRGPTDTGGSACLVYLGARRAVRIPWNVAEKEGRSGRSDDTHAAAAMLAARKLWARDPYTQDREVIRATTHVLPDGNPHAYCVVIEWRRSEVRHG